MCTVRVPTSRMENTYRRRRVTVSMWRESAVPGQEGAGGDEAVAAQPGRQVPGEGGEHGAVRPRQVRPGAELSAQYRDLVAQHEDLDILGILRPRQQQEQSEQPDEDQVE